ncbi:MAG: hypothetical protein KBG28_18230 [Kofleriaceae bacterium]|nr:hypothetical protein [Kofleriaceae bacterium]MBP9205919.1 hypothetical protein [Kofleriaceae bacterium]
MSAPRISVQVIRALGQALARRPRGTTAPPPGPGCERRREPPWRVPSPGRLEADLDEEPTGVFNPPGPATAPVRAG